MEQPVAKRARTEDDNSADTFFNDTEQLRPKHLAATRSKMDAFVADAKHRGVQIVVVTSGGTTVPLEMNTVRFIDNFSTGTRGAYCTEEFIKAGYAVILLHRDGSNFPFLTKLVNKMRNDPIGLIGSSEPSAAPSDISERLLPIGFTTIFDYLFLLREACLSLGTAASAGIIFLAAAVSDFYIPEKELATEKIQSRSHDGLNIQLRNVPKLLGMLRVWAPSCFIISFKLETNSNILLAKAAGSITRYGVDMVCSNMLQSHRDLVTLVWRHPAESEISFEAATISGDESKPIAVYGLQTCKIERHTNEIIDIPLVATIAKAHAEFVRGGSWKQVAAMVFGSNL